jgi:ADP-ribosylglycohydrolase
MEVDPKVEEDEEVDKDDIFLDRAKGCILGAFVGDAAGAVLEFMEGKMSKEKVKWATVT